MRFREQQFDVLKALATRGDIAVKPEDVAGVVFALTGIGRIIGQEHELGISLGHDEAYAFVSRLIGTQDHE